MFSEGRHERFLTVTPKEVVILSLIASNIIHLADPCKDDGYGGCPLIEFCIYDICKNQYLELTVNILQLLFLSLFAMPFSGLLVYVTLKNFCNGKTTSEMYSKKARSQSAATDSELTDRSSLLDN